MKYFHEAIEAKWQQYWAENQTFKAQQPSANNHKPKYYVLDMFPYPSGAGLHVGHPLGYIASDIVARYKRHKGFNVLHPQGYDSFGLPAEQYAIQTGQHPEKTTRENIARYREQLDKIGFSFDWDREVRTSNPDYYKHTQWIFIQLFNSWYNKTTDKAEDITTLIAIFEKEGNATVNAVCDDNIAPFSATAWNAFSSDEQQKILLQYRLTYLAETEVNWCPALGTVLANDEIVNGVSERGGHPVIRKKMTQWSMRISAYAERLLQGLDTIDWSESIKESQRNWIGKSVGATVRFNLLPHPQPLSKGEGSLISEQGYKTANPLYAKELVALARNNRKEKTEAENILWQELRNSNLGHKIRRQHYIGNFIVDFICLDKRLIIEVDGEYHNETEQKERDDERTLLLEQKYFFKVIRFTNQEVENDLGNVLSKIKKELSKRESLGDSTPLSFGEGLGVRSIEVFTTRPDTIFGVTFMTLAPEHELVSQITTTEQKVAVEAYVEATAKRSERERMADVKTISGVFTGAFAEHPFTKELIPIWIGDYVLAGYGTGAVMAVPCGDERDYAFAKYFQGTVGMPEIKNIFSLTSPPSEGLGEASAFAEKGGFELVNSDFLNGLDYKVGTKQAIAALEQIGAGKAKVNYRLRDAVFSRQRYWGEPIPIYYKNNLPYPIPLDCLPLKLPEVEKYLPTEDGQPPLGNASAWYWDEEKQCVTTPPPSEGAGGRLELNTMPGWAGSSFYWMRYMDAHNENEFASAEALNYWQNVDLYIGGSEHATGHLLYSRFWNKFLKDRGYAPTEEPFKKLINQGMILGMSAFVYKIVPYFIKNEGEYNQEMHIVEFDKPYLVSYKYYKALQEKSDGTKLWGYVTDDFDSKTYGYLLSVFYEKNKNAFNRFEPNFYIQKSHVDLSVINDITNELDIEAFKNHPLYADYKDAEFILENGELYVADSSPSGRSGGAYIVGREVEKMSKSKYNVVNPDDICNHYGADTLRLYEMFLGPLEQAKPWNTAGITGVYGFLKKLWRLYFDDNGLIVTDNEPSKESLKSLHKTIKKVTEDIDAFSFNTSVSQFMICVNELQSQNCHERAILEPLAILVSPYAPHIAEELWFALKDLKIEALKDYQGISYEPFPICNEKYLVESEKEYPVSFNGKMRFTIKLPLDLSQAQIETTIMADERTIKQLDGNTPKKVIIVPGKVINFVI
jgi:leucyl-tRNA synthetase